MITLAVTGGIGSGKSAVCLILTECGVPVYDSDSRTRNLYDSDRSLTRQITQAMSVFSPQTNVLDSEGKIDRKALASIVFSNPKALSALEALVHPAVLEDFLRWREQREKEGFRVVAIESAIILEKPLFRNVADKVFGALPACSILVKMAVSSANASTEQHKMSSKANFLSQKAVQNDPCNFFVILQKALIFIELRVFG